MAEAPGDAASKDAAPEDVTTAPASQAVAATPEATEDVAVAPVPTEAAAGMSASAMDGEPAMPAPGPAGTEDVAVAPVPTEAAAGMSGSTRAAVSSAEGAAAAASSGGGGARAEAREAAWRARLSQPVHPPTRAEKFLYWFVHLILVRGLSRLWFRLEVVDRDWVPAHGPFVVAPVHRSNIDFFLVAAITKTRMRYIGKDSLWKWGPLGRFIGMLGAFPVRRGAADREALRTCIQVIENGEPLVIFPEGTRQSGPVVQEVFDGPAYIAARTGVPVVPVGIGGTEKAMPKGAKWIKPRKVVLVVGEPLEPPTGDGTGRPSRRAIRQLSEQLKSDIQSLFDEAQQRAG